MIACGKRIWPAVLGLCGAVVLGAGLCCAVAIGAGLCAVKAAAQTEVERARVAAQVARVAGKLPAESQEVITRLTLLGHLPDGMWKMHGGDLAHGEATDLDDSSWETVKIPGTAPNDAVWFRQTYTVPETLYGYDLTGARIWFQFHAYANGPMPEILYFNGRRVALGDDLEPVVLFDEAKPGDKVTVAVKLLHTVDVKNLRGATHEYRFSREPAEPGRSAHGVSERRRCWCPRLRRAMTKQDGHAERGDCGGGFEGAGCARSGEVRREPEGRADRSWKRCCR